MKNDKIHKRGLTSFFTLFGFLIMSITGLVLYVVPAGRVAYWVDWQFLALTKTQWGNIHILSSILFVVAGAFHIYFNWKPLMNYFKSRATRTAKLKKELSIATAVSALIILSSLYPIPPLSYLLDFNEYIKEVWIIEDDYEPPFGHAELMSLAVFAQKMDMDLGKAEAELKARGIEYDNNRQTLEEIAEINDVSPMDLYLMIKKYEEPERLAPVGSYTPEQVELEFSGIGIGNKSLAGICEQLGIDTSAALSSLERIGLSATTYETLKKIAEKKDLNPIDVLKVLLVEDYTLE